MMEHAVDGFKDVALFMKCDDDTFINTRLVICIIIQIRLLKTTVKYYKLMKT